MNILTDATTAEAERAAYINHSPALVEALQELQDARARIEELESALEAAESAAEDDSLAAWERENGPAAAYKDFFFDCFAMLDGHYPCPSVTNDYDKSVIFDAIVRGEQERHS